MACSSPLDIDTYADKIVKFHFDILTQVLRKIQPDREEGSNGELALNFTLVDLVTCIWDQASLSIDF